MRTQRVWLTALLLAGFIGLSPGQAQEVVNLLPNGDFEAGNAGPWNIYGNITFEVVTECVGAAVPEGPIVGDHCLHLVVPSAGGGPHESGMSDGSFTFEKGKKYTFSCFMKCKSGTLEFAMKPEHAADPWEGYGYQVFTATEEWQEFYVTTPVFTQNVTPASPTFHLAFAAGDFWMDGVQLYEGDYVPTAVGSRVVATDPRPEDAAIDVPRDTVLSWEVGSFAVAHDVYFGTSFADIDAASRDNPLGVLVSQGQSTATYDPAGLLEFGQTYYWRVDEVNAAPDNTIFKGAVWSFTAEPFAYPVENILATTNAISGEGAGPENTINGSGLNSADEHSIAATDMWLVTSPPAEPLYIQYEFDSVYKLYEMQVWNYNVQFELALGFGLKDVTVEYSQDGTEWTTLGDVQFAQASARANYRANTTVSFDGAAAKYVRLNVNSGWGMLGQYGLSEVRFMYLSVRAREPEPADGATDVSVTTELAWRAGRDVISHEVYFGTDAETLALAGIVNTNSYAPGELNLATTYYWQVNEVQETESWEGAVWSFATQEYLVVDDFESYNDDLEAGTTIFDTWLDGWVNDTGSTVGYFDAPFAEQTIVHGGRQSMPLFYDNAGLTMSETEYSLDQDWTANGIRSLSLYFYGAEGNTGQLYVKINNTRIDYDGPAEDIARPSWQVWNIDLSPVGNLSNVRSLTIGVEGSGAQGVVYIDDIRLYPEVVDDASAQ